MTGQSGPPSGRTPLSQHLKNIFSRCYEAFTLCNQLGGKKDKIIPSLETARNGNGWAQPHTGGLKLHFKTPHRNSARIMLQTHADPGVLCVGGFDKFISAVHLANIPGVRVRRCLLPRRVLVFISARE